MNWNPEAKLITDWTPVFIRQSLKLAEPELACPNPISFTFDDLCLSLARTTSLLSAILELSHDERQELILANGCLLATHMNLFVDAAAEEFLFTKKINLLADEQRTSLAAKVGSAVADLIMQRMGFYWSANARELKLKQTGKQAIKKIPDFVYDPAAEHGFRPGSVVVVEAKGSLSKQKARRRPVMRLARDAYDEQVRHMIGAKGKGLVVASGYAIAFGAVPGARASTLVLASPQRVRVDAPSRVRVHSLSAAASHQQQMAPQITEQVRPMHQELMHQELLGRKGGAGGPPDGGGGREDERRSPSGRIAYANYESVFLLCGAMSTARAIRTILSGQSLETLSTERLIQEFWIFEYREIRFWLGDDWFWQRSEKVLAIYEPSAIAFLRAFSEHRDAIPETLPLNVAPVASGAGPERGFEMAIQGDGLAMVPYYGGHRGHWDIRAGKWV